MSGAVSRLSKLLLRLTQYPLKEEGVRRQNEKKKGEKIWIEKRERERKARVFYKSPSRDFTYKELDCKAQINIIRHEVRWVQSRYQGNAANTKNRKQKQDYTLYVVAKGMYYFNEYCVRYKILKYELCKVKW